MKKLFLAAAVLSFALSMMLPAAMAASPNEELIPDPALKAAIIKQLNLNTDTVTKDDLGNLKSLFVSGKVNSLEGLQYAVNLEALGVVRAQVWNLTPISHLSHLRELELASNNISDISPLKADLNNLEYLDLMNNHIQDIGVIANLTNLKSINVAENEISDITPLKNLKNLGSGYKGLLFKGYMPSVLVLYNNYIDVKNPAVKGDLEAVSANMMSVFETAKRNESFVAGYPPYISYEEQKDLNHKPSPRITVKLNGEVLLFEQNPVIVGERTVVPLRAIFEALGASVSWNDSTQTVTAVKGDHNISMTINNPNAEVNGKTVTLDQAPILVNGHTMVPVRFVSEALGCKVDWDASLNQVVITTE